MSVPNPFRPGYSPPQQPVGQKETFGSRPSDVAEPSMVLPLVFIGLLVGLSIISCGGLGYFFARQGREAEVAEAKPAAKPQLKSKAKVSPPSPEVSPPVRTPPSFTPPAFQPPPPFVPPPAARPVEAPLTPPSRPAPPASPPSASPPSASPQTDDEKLTAILRQLNDPQPSRPLLFSLAELDRLPVQESRREEVAKALEPHFRSTDVGAMVQITKVAATWGTEANVESLTSLLDHENTLIRWQAIRALAKISPTPKTAEKLAAKAGESSNGSALRDAFKLLGEEGEIALLRRLDGSDERTRREVVGLLGDTGTEISRPVLEELAMSDADASVKSRARRALRQLDDRKKN